MQVHFSIDSLPAFRHAVLTIGTFDGVHLGHREIIRRLIEEARRIGGESVILTFHPHPRKVLRAGSQAVPLLNTIEEKTALLDSLGIDHLVVIPFTEAFAQMSASQYVEEFLLRYFQPHTIIIGYDHRFGKGRSGNYSLLEQYRDQGRFALQEIPEQLLNSNTVSSTRIREALLNGHPMEAGRLLGYDYYFEGKVVKGNQLGRTLGYPTANLEPLHPEKLIPSNGVYAVTCSIKKDLKVFADSQGKMAWQGMMNIGIRPTVDGTGRVIEVNIFEFNEVIYGDILRVTVKNYLRPEMKFNGLDALKAQLAQDRDKALQLLQLNA